MIQKIIIPSEVLPLVKGKEWYHQRFDGSPMYLYSIAEAEVVRESRKPAGTEADVRASFFKDGKADWYLDLSDIRRGSHILIKLASKDSHLSTKLLSKWKNDEVNFQKFFDKFSQINLRSLSDTGLFKLFEQYHNLGFKRFTSSAIIDHFALGTDEHIAKKLRQEIGLTKKESEFTEVFSIATAPVHQSFINQAEMELLAIAIKKPKDLAAIRKYQQKYYWLKNNYITAQILTVKHFQKEIDLWRKSSADLKAKYRQLAHTPKINLKKKQALFKRYKLSRLLKTLLKISEDFTWWQDERKKATYLNIHLGTQILGEMARRRKVNPELTKFLVPGEVGSFFKQAKPSIKELTKRQRSSVLVGWRGGEFMGVGEQVDKIRSRTYAIRPK